jgi:hypothetical protein
VSRSATVASRFNLLASERVAFQSPLREKSVSLGTPKGARPIERRPRTFMLG